MSEKIEYALIRVTVNGDISKPLDTLIRKVSKGFGRLYEQYYIKRKASAESEAALIKAQAETQMTELQQRALDRLIVEEAKKQKNIEDIIAQTSPYLKENADADLIDDDWLTNFVDKSRIISDKEMQEIWARLLAGEVNDPGTYSRRTVNFISDFDKTDADLFTKLCGFCWIIGGKVPLFFNLYGEIYKNNGIYYESIKHLEDIGLIQVNEPNVFYRINLPQKFNVNYYDQSLGLECPNGPNDRLNIGHVKLSKIGQELFPICGSKPVEGFIEYVKENWKSFSPQIL